MANKGQVRKEELPALLESPKKDEWFVNCNVVEHTIKDPVFGSFEVFFTYNAWWKDTAKIHLLIAGFKMGLTIEECWSYAGITKTQWEYFNNTHKDFLRVKNACKQIPAIVAKRSVFETLPVDGKFALDYLKATKPDEFKNKLEIELTPIKGIEYYDRPIGGEKIEGGAEPQAEGSPGLPEGQDN